MKRLTKKAVYLLILSGLMLCCFSSCKYDDKGNNTNTKISSDSISNNVDTVNNAYERKEVQQMNRDEEKPPKNNK